MVLFDLCHWRVVSLLLFNHFVRSAPYSKLFNTIYIVFSDFQITMTWHDMTWRSFLFYCLLQLANYTKIGCIVIQFFESIAAQMLLLLPLILLLSLMLLLLLSLMLDDRTKGFGPNDGQLHRRATSQSTIYTWQNTCDKWICICINAVIMCSIRLNLPFANKGNTFTISELGII